MLYNTQDLNIGEIIILLYLFEVYKTFLITRHVVMLNVFWYYKRTIDL